MTIEEAIEQVVAMGLLSGRWSRFHVDGNKMVTNIVRDYDNSYNYPEIREARALMEATNANIDRD